jgi:hypothetical protein
VRGDDVHGIVGERCAQRSPSGACARRRSRHWPALAHELLKRMTCCGNGTRATRTESPERPDPTTPPSADERRSSPPPQRREQGRTA